MTTSDRGPRGRHPDDGPGLPRTRRGCMAQGFFPAGPMDHFALPRANLLVGNPASAAGARGHARQASRSASTATRRSRSAAPRPRSRSTASPSRSGRAGGSPGEPSSGSGSAQGPGFRLYVAVSGGIDVPLLFGSRATYTMGALGGLEGRALQAGDRLPLGDAGEPRRPASGSRKRASRVRARVGDRGRCAGRRPPRTT